MSEYQPTETEIDKVLAKVGGDTRKLAAAYLKASKRARQAETAFNVLHQLTEAHAALCEGDGDEALANLKKVERTLNSSAEIEKERRTNA